VLAFSIAFILRFSKVDIYNGLHIVGSPRASR
jgi:hypothetical protein